MSISFWVYPNSLHFFIYLLTPINTFELHQPIQATTLGIKPTSTDLLKVLKPLFYHVGFHINLNKHIKDNWIPITR